MAAPTETAPAAANPAPAAGKGNGKPCFSFSKYGECKYGADCKYSHDKADAKPVTGRADAPAGGDRGGRGGARGGRGGARGGARGGGAAGASGPRPIRLKKPCRAFQMGEECPYGDKCHFSHDPEGDKQKFLVAQAKRAIEDKKSLCVWIQKGVVCPHGSICRHSHQIPDAKAAPAAAAPAAAAAKPAAAAEQRAAPAAAAAAPAVVAAAAGQAPAAKPAAHTPAPAGAHPPAPKQAGGQSKGHGKRPNHQLQQPKH